MSTGYPKKQKRLTAAFVRHAPPGKHYDGNGLILKVEPGGSRRWIQRIAIHGKRRDTGLGSCKLVSLREARELALDNRKLARAGGDPIALKRRPDIPLFSEAAERVIQIHKETWRNPRTEKNWRASLRDYAEPRLGKKRIDQIDAADVMSVLLPIWNQKKETSRRLRRRLSAIFRWSITEGFRSDDPAGPAISAALPRNGGQRKHMKALPHAEVSDALAKVRTSGAYLGTKLCFELLVLTATRSGEARLATWDEIDFEKKVWTIPAERTKTAREFRIPLSSHSLKILNKARELTDGSGLIFPSPTGRTLSDSTISKLVRENGIKAVPHGFRSSFRDWCAEDRRTT